MRVNIFKKIIFFSSIFVGNILIAQNIAIVNTSLIVKANSTYDFYLAFQTDDEIIVNIKEKTLKPIDEIQILEYPNVLKFIEKNSKTIANKKIKVIKRSVYYFKINNTSDTEKTFITLIYRKPFSDSTMYFNTKVTWKDTYDTTYTLKKERKLTKYDTITSTKERKIFSSLDTTYKSLFDKTIKVLKTELISLIKPGNTYLPNIENVTEKTEIKSWAYYIGVGKASAVYYQEQNKQAKVKAADVNSSSKFLVEILNGYNLPHIQQDSAADNVNYYFNTIRDNQLYLFVEGTALATFGTIVDNRTGGITLNLSNPNINYGIDVDVKVLAMYVTTKYNIEKYKVFNYSPIYTTKEIMIPKVIIKKIPQVAIQ